ncbi:hypothetical protein [Succinimonas sp.]|uniref:hypothetical protein n=1 Tax=Succinimonas sp. TaxID=1936151 RepID=UPI00386D6BBB
MTLKEYCASCKNEGSHKCHSCMGKYYDGVLQGAPTKYIKKPQANADRIRAMSDEELAEDYCKTLLKVMQYFGIKNTGTLEDAVRARLEWLKQPAEE